MVTPARGESQKAEVNPLKTAGLVGADKEEVGASYSIQRRVMKYGTYSMTFILYVLQCLCSCVSL